MQCSQQPFEDISNIPISHMKNCDSKTLLIVLKTGWALESLRKFKKKLKFPDQLQRHIKLFCLHYQSLVREEMVVQDTKALIWQNQESNIYLLHPNETRPSDIPASPITFSYTSCDPFHDTQWRLIKAHFGGLLCEGLSVCVSFIKSRVRRWRPRFAGPWQEQDLFQLVSILLKSNEGERIPQASNEKKLLKIFEK